MVIMDADGKTINQDEYFTQLDKEKKEREELYELELHRADRLQESHMLSCNENALFQYKKFYDIIKTCNLSEDDIFLIALKGEIHFYCYHIFDSGEETIFALSLDHTRILYFQGQVDISVENIFYITPLNQIKNACYQKPREDKTLTKKDLLINSLELERYLDSSLKPQRPLKLRVARELYNSKKKWPRSRANEFLRCFNMKESHKHKEIKTSVYTSPEEIEIAERCFDYLYPSLERLKTKRHSKKIKAWLLEKEGVKESTKEGHRILHLANPNYKGGVYFCDIENIKRQYKKENEIFQNGINKLANNNRP